MFGLRSKVGLLCLLLCLGVVYAHDEHKHEHEHSSHEHEHEHKNPASDPAIAANGKQIYFTYPEHRGLLYGHILVSCVGWIFIMPISAVLHVSGSRYHFPTKLLFLATHGIGAFLGFLYDNAIPDLYPGNSYRKLGWAIIWILVVQSVFGTLGTVVRSALLNHLGSKEERSGFMTVSMDDAEEQAYRPSGDSGQGTEEHYSRPPSTSSLYGNRGRSDLETLGLHRIRLEKPPFARRLVDTSRLEDFLSRRMPFVFNTRVAEICGFGYSLIERFLVVLGFMQICLGIVAGSGIFMGDRVFNGLAHFIKGGIFFLYGVITLGRWLGAFSELGWAWNLRPPREFGGKWREKMPSAEMVESSVMFVYGCSNVFLEHLAGAGGAWSHGDLEHLSIAFMFIGGGLCGMLVESRKVRDLLNCPISTYIASQHKSYAAISPEHGNPINYSFSYNPLPALIIFILGTMMSKHHQSSALSTMIHAQWGTLLSGFSVFRLGTYALLYLSPPSSYFPSRPPTEVMGSFCLMAGGLVFMSSNKDTVAYLDRVGADAMFILTVIIGITALLMSWITGVMAVKGWALRREQS